ncbi:MAG: hypothetical protein OXI39_14665 [Gemmatimonadota bacterium]|uniref:DinB family protein n=1 Tax=Candidatus Palauibacter scopulicola TaxID=3056741 RepID=UPI00238714AB|nr:DinB family protein [Candidatus Palauibacter scopulicola]MDE2664226.1 hypothetical protein [Candidatus Palauibacter scopulicola]
MKPPTDSYTAPDSLAGVRAGIRRCLERAADVAQLDIAAPEVSAWSVQDHLEHLLFSDRSVLDWILNALARPNPVTREESPHEFGVALLARGSIPRGRGPAPDFTLPDGMAPGELQTGFQALRELADGLKPRLAALDTCLHTLPHHVLGHFTPAEWLRFLHLHHRHHEAIIRDILETSRSVAPTA